MVTNDVSCGWSAETDVPWITIGTTSASAYAQAVAADHPIGYWRLNDPVASTSAADASGLAHPGTSTAGITFGRPGALADGSTSAGFDGATGVVEVPHVAAFEVPAITWEAWVHVPSISGLPRTILNKGGSAGAFALRIQPSSNQLSVDYTLTGGTPQSVTLAPTVVGAGWVHVAFTYDGATWRAYINGAETDSGAATGTLSTSTDPLVFGRDGTSSLDWYDGRLSDVAVYPYALSVDQLAHHVAQRTVAASGGGQVAFALEANASGTTRTGSLTIAGVVVPVSQASTEGVAIVGSASPSPNAAGWNTTDVTVSFVCAGAGSLTCPPPVVVSQDGERDITGQVSNEAGATDSTTVHVKVDKTAPVVTMTAPMGNAILAPGPVVVRGRAIDAMSDAAVSCGGVAAAMEGDAFSCDVMVPAGGTTVRILATDAAGHTRIRDVGLRTADPNGPQPSSLRLTPQAITMTVGQTRSLSLRDDLGRAPQDATWTLDQPSRMTLTTSPAVSLTATAAGSVTVTATWGGLTTSTDITVVTGADLQAGRTLWTSPRVGGTGSKIVQGGVTLDGRRLLYSLEGTTLRALSTDGAEAWTAEVGAVSQLSGDPVGGAVAMVNITPTGTPSFVLRRFDADGQMSEWAVPNASHGSKDAFAISPDGPLYLVECVGTVCELVGKDIGLGAGPRVPLPTGTLTTCTGGTTAAPEGCTETRTAFGAGTPTVMSDGRVAVPVVTGSRFVIINGPQLFAPEMSVVFVTPAGEQTTQIIPNEWMAQPQLSWVWPHKVIPNGEGGVLVTWMSDRFSNSAGQWAAQLVALRADGTPTGGASIGQMWGDIVLGDHGVALAATYRGAHQNMVTPIGADGNVVGSPDFYASDVDVTSMVATAGGSFVMSLSSGHMIGSDEGYDAMRLTHAVSLRDGTWAGISPSLGGNSLLAAGTSAGVLSSFGGALVGMAGPIVNRADSEWPSADGNEQSTNAVERYYANYSAIDLVATESVDSVFERFVKTLAGVNQGSTAFVTGLPFAHTGQIVTFLLKVPSQFLTPLWYLQGPFAVRVIRYDPTRHTISVKTDANHPLVGWRYFRAFQSEPGHVVIETGAIDRPAPGLTNMLGFYVSSWTGDQLKIWKEWLSNARERLVAEGAHVAPDSRFNVIDGRWERGSKLDIWNNICGPPSLGICR